MRFTLLLPIGAFLPSMGIAAPAATSSVSSTQAADDKSLYQRDNLCSLKSPPALCQPDPSVTVEETAERAYKFYRAFVVDGDPKTMFSLIDSTYKNTSQQHHPGYADGPNTIWSLFCNGRPAGSAASSSWCFDASTNMSYAQYSTVDRWRWLDGCVHEHWDVGEKMPAKDKCYKLSTDSAS
ncbi:hypothetical protein SPI_01034 [Niveomyces insectorum RCEF 264]|uniref:Uncharacterized protein n=1 Tax=Niveomyces insectorum RCEF 264 TaxID=1081102 RepID=A0A167YLY5_9HYPO|nr:hypothetical protein SPI_01034 [Niveomyces insectorum RCEF 264]